MRFLGDQTTSWPQLNTSEVWDRPFINDLIVKKLANNLFLLFVNLFAVSEIMMYPLFSCDVLVLSMM